MTALPKIKYPYYETRIPSTGVLVKFRPFTVSEEKILLMSADSGEYAPVKSAVKQIIENCVENVGDADSLTSFDMEYLFLQIRSKSVNNVVNLGIKCGDCSFKKGEDFFSPAEVNLNEIKIYVNENGEAKDFNLEAYKKTSQVKLNDELAVQLRSPLMKDLEIGETFMKSGKDVSEDDIGFEMMARCTVSISTPTETIKAADSTLPELVEFYKSLPRIQLEKVDALFSAIPYVGIKGTCKCRECSAELQYDLKGLESFFI